MHQRAYVLIFCFTDLVPLFLSPIAYELSDNYENVAAGSSNFDDFSICVVLRCSLIVIFQLFHAEISANLQVCKARLMHFFCKLKLLFEHLYQLCSTSRRISSRKQYKLQTLNFAHVLFNTSCHILNNKI